MDTDRNRKPDLTPESSTKEGPGGTERNVETSESGVRSQELGVRRWETPSPKPQPFLPLRSLLLYKGETTASELLGSAEAESIEDATLGYGVGAWHLVNDEADQAQKLFEQIVQGPMWPAFGHTAAEAELARAARPNNGSDS